MTIRSDNRGQTTVLTLVFMTVLLGMAALVRTLWLRATNRPEAPGVARIAPRESVTKDAIVAQSH